MFFSRYAKKVTMLVRGDQLTASQIIIDKVTSKNSGIEILYHSVVEAFEGQGSKLNTVRIKNLKSGEKGELHPAAVFIFISQQSTFTG